MDNIDEMNEIMAARMQKEPSLQKSDDAQTVISSQFVGDCLRANELGDALMYIALNRGKRLYNQTSVEWMRWSGHHWEIDRGSADSMAAMEGVVAEYQKEAKTLVDRISDEKNTEAKTKLFNIQKSIYKRIDRLRSIRGCNNCLSFTTRCEDRLVAINEDFDQVPWLLACNNGVVDLRTGELSEGNPNDLLYKHCPHDWTGLDSPTPIWDKAILEIMSNNQEMVDFFARLLGYAITGLSSEHILPVLWGKGRNGKGTIIETLCHVMGPLAAPIQSEMLMSQSFSRSSAGPSPDIMSLKGLRIAFASESDEGRRIDVNRVKYLTGGDSLVARCPHDKYDTTFKPTHKLFLLTNNKPHAPADDFAFWQRCVLIPFLLSYVDSPQAADERQKDKFLGEKLESEASGILAWLVRGCLQWQQSGLDYPSLVREATGAYQKSEDMLGDFIDELCLIGEEYRVSSTHLYDAFHKWYEVNYSKKVPSQKRFGTLMVKKFERIKYGVYFYLGLKLAELTE